MMPPPLPAFNLLATNNQEEDTDLMHRPSSGLFYIHHFSSFCAISRTMVKEKGTWWISHL
jgi:hypothetical membrane protein